VPQKRSTLVSVVAGINLSSMLATSSTDRVFILAGAGVSAESGIPTFRGVGGLWRNYRIEEVASPIAWHRDPRLVWEFYSMPRKVAASAKANLAHVALAELEGAAGTPFRIVGTLLFPNRLIEVVVTNVVAAQFRSVITLPTKIVKFTLKVWCGEHTPRPPVIPTPLLEDRRVMCRTCGLIAANVNRTITLLPKRLKGLRVLQAVEPQRAVQAGPGRFSQMVAYLTMPPDS
jgi:hypothetical protein